MGNISIRIPVQNFSFIPLRRDTVPPDVPFLRVLNMLDKKKLVVDNGDHKVLRSHY